MHVPEASSSAASRPASMGSSEEDESSLSTPLYAANKSMTRKAWDPVQPTGTRGHNEAVASVWPPAATGACAMG